MAKSIARFVNKHVFVTINLVRVRFFKTMSEQHKLIHPIKYFRDFLSNKLRQDGRKFDKYRPIGLNSGSFRNCLGSSAVKIGNSNVVCGIRAELAKPKVSSPQDGFIVPNIDMSFTATYYGATHDSDVLNCLLYNVLVDSGCIKLKELCISRKKLVWALYVDIICLEADGAIADAITLACAAAINDLSLPKVTIAEISDEIKIDYKIKIKINAGPVLSTFCMFDGVLLADPTYNEECISNTLIHVGNIGRDLILFHKRGGSSIKKSDLDSALSATFKKDFYVTDLLDKNKQKDIDKDT